VCVLCLSIGEARAEIFQPSIEEAAERARR
jgi:hypothetical protein